MKYLKELPPGTVWPHLLDAISGDAIREIETYAAGRKSDVARGAETPMLAAVLVDKYAAGMAKALCIVGVESDLQTVADRLVREIDPDFIEHQKARWEARPATIAVSLT